MRWLVVIGVLLAAAIVGWMAYGTSNSPSDAGVVPLDQLPPGFLDTARKELPQAKFDKAWRLKNGNYEIRGKDAKGKAREVELDPKGAIVEVD
jgi:hypothetical protein